MRCELLPQSLRVVAPAVPDEIVECGPARFVERDRQEQDCVRGGDARELRQGGLVVVDVLDDVEGADQIEGAVGKGNRSHGSAYSARATPMQSRDCRRAQIDEVRPLDREARSESWCDLESLTGLRDEAAHERPRIESLGLDQPRIRPECVVEPPIRLPELPVVRRACSRLAHRTRFDLVRERHIQLASFSSSETVEHSSPFSRKP